MNLSTTQIGDLIVWIHKDLKTITEKNLKELGLGMGQLHILMLFYLKPNTSYSQNQIVDLLKIDKGNVSRNIKKLVNKDYLEIIDPSSRSYMLTSQGHAIKDQIMATFMSMHQSMIQGISKEALQTTLKTLCQINSNLKESI
jgi:DNA-binding MarR family transcriptional regulator